MTYEVTANVIHENNKLTMEFDRLITPNPARIGMWVAEVMDRADILCADEELKPALDLTIVRR